MEPKVTDRVDAVSKAGASKQTREVNNERLEDLKSALRFFIIYHLSFFIYHLAKLRARPTTSSPASSADFRSLRGNALRGKRWGYC